MARGYLKFRVGSDGMFEVEAENYESDGIELDSAPDLLGADEKMNFLLVTNFEWEAELAERLFHIFKEEKILECDYEKQEIRYSRRGHEMLDEIRDAGAIEMNNDGESLDFLEAIMILAKYLGLVELIGCEQEKESFKFTEHGLHVFYDLLLRLEDEAGKDDKIPILETE